MEKQPLGIIFINNGMAHLIQRSTGLRSRYIKGVKRILAQWVKEGRPGARMYQRSGIYKVVNDQREINGENKIIKDAFLALCDELGVDTSPQKPVQVEQGELVAA